MNNPTQLAEKAVATWLATQSIGDISASNIFRGFDDGLHALPSITVTGENAEPVSIFSGTWRTTVRVEVRSAAEDGTEDAHSARATAVFDLLHASDLSANLAAALTSFDCQYAVTTSSSEAVQNRQWISTLGLQMWVGGNDLT